MIPVNDGHIKPSVLGDGVGMPGGVALAMQAGLLPRWEAIMHLDYASEQIAKMIDHSLLNPVLTGEELELGCGVAILTECTRRIQEGK